MTRIQLYISISCEIVRLSTRYKHDLCTQHEVRYLFIILSDRLESDIKWYRFIGTNLQKFSGRFQKCCLKIAGLWIAAK